jgi:hypothetical protein
MAVVAVPAKAVPKVLEEAGRKGVKVAVVVSGGFAEAGNYELEAEAVRAAGEHGMRILGPNCVGVYNAEVGLDTMFLPEEKAARPAGGPIAFISQSGAVMTAVLDWAAAEGVGIGLAVNVGNRADIDEGEILELLRGLDYVRVAVCATAPRRAGGPGRGSPGSSNPGCRIHELFRPSQAQSDRTHVVSFEKAERPVGNIGKRGCLLRIFSVSSLCLGVPFLAFSAR